MSTVDERGYFYRPGVVSEPHRLFEQMLAEIPWTEQMRARRTASMGRPYNYAGATYPDSPWHPVVKAVGESLIPAIGFEPTNCLMNLYPTGEHTIGWHNDDVTILAPGTGIAILSLGDTRTMVLRSQRGQGFEYERLALASGSLFWMSQALQSTHKHSIRREPGVGPRVSLTYRRIVQESIPVDRPRWGQR